MPKQAYVLSGETLADSRSSGAQSSLLSFGKMLLDFSRNPRTSPAGGESHLQLLRWPACGQGKLSAHGLQGCLQVSKAAGAAGVVSRRCSDGIFQLAWVGGEQQVSMHSIIQSLTGHFNESLLSARYYFYYAG